MIIFKTHEICVKAKRSKLAFIRAGRLCCTLTGYPSLSVQRPVIFLQSLLGLVALLEGIQLDYRFSFLLILMHKTSEELSILSSIGQEALPPLSCNVHAPISLCHNHCQLVGSHSQVPKNP